MQDSPEQKTLFTPSEMMGQAEQFALGKTQKRPATVLGLAIMAGAFIGLAFLFYITVTTGSSGLGWGPSRLFGGLAFSMGLILIVVCGGELFTSSVLTCIAWANRQISAGQMLATWGRVYAGNFIGAIALLLLVAAAGSYQLDGGQWGANALAIAQHKLHHSWLQAFALGVLCNLLVCLAIWLTFSSSNPLTKAALVILPVAMFVSSGFEHCVANMFMVPLGIVIHATAPAEFWLQTGLNPAAFNDLTLVNFISNNLVPVTLGNIIGGAVLVGMANWCLYRRPSLELTEPARITKTTSLSSIKDIIMRASTTVNDIYNPNALTLAADMPTSLAVDKLLKHDQSGAPVLDNQGHLVGFFSAHDLMVELWCSDYEPQDGQKVMELMRTDVVAIDVNHSLGDVIEYMAIDKDQLYPTSPMGYATSMSSLTLEQRARSMKVKKPQVLPVLDQGRFVGVVGRQQVMGAVRELLGEHLGVITNEQNERKLA